MKTKHLFIKLITLFGVTLLTLNGCAKTATESPEDVLQKFKETAKEIKAADFTASLAMVGIDKGDEMDFNLVADVKVDRREDMESKADVNLKIDGSLKAGDKSMSGNFNFKFRTLGEDYYFNLIEFDSTDPNVEKYKVLVEPYLKKWQHISSDFIPENIRGLQEKDEETLAKEEELKELFVNTRFFDVVKEFGVENLNGKKVYHYGLKLNKDGLSQYVRKAASINGREMTEAEVEETVAFAESVTDIELWIGTKDYYVYKGEVSLSGEGLEEKGVKADVTVTYIANSYNTNLKIEAPADAEEFNPLSLLMDLQMSGMIGGEEPAIEEVGGLEMMESEAMESEVVE